MSQSAGISLATNGTTLNNSTRQDDVSEDYFNWISNENFIIVVACSAAFLVIVIAMTTIICICRRAKSSQKYVLNIFSEKGKRNRGYVGGHYHCSSITSPLYVHPTALDQSRDGAETEVRARGKKNDDPYYVEPDYDGADTLECRRCHSITPQRSPVIMDGENGSLPRKDGEPIFVTTIIL